MTTSLSHSKSEQTTADLGWTLLTEGRSCPPPSPNEYVIDDVPYRNGSIDLTDALGMEPTYPMRELSYQFGKAASSAADLYAWAAACRNAELTDGCTSDVFTGVTFTGASSDTDASNLQKVTLTFKANPFKKDGSL